MRRNLSENEKVIWFAILFPNRLLCMKNNPRVVEEGLPASLSRESEALVIIKAVQTGQNMTEQFIGHHQRTPEPARALNTTEGKS